MIALPLVSPAGFQKSRAMAFKAGTEALTVTVCTAVCVTVCTAVWVTVWTEATVTVWTAVCVMTTVLAGACAAALVVLPVVAVVLPQAARRAAPSIPLAVATLRRSQARLVRVCAMLPPPRLIQRGRPRWASHRPLTGRLIVSDASLARQTGR